MATIELGTGELTLAALLLLANAGVAIALRLSLGRQLVTAALRAVLQLLLLGFLLEWIFGLERGWIVLAWMVGMTLLAGFEALRRARHRVPGLASLSLMVMLASSMAVTLYATQLVLRVEPWYSPRYLIPILGMVLGNSLNGISLGLQTVLAGFRARRDEIDLLLAHGATVREASRDVMREAVRTGMIPILNSMIAAGAISIPGMMTGQILAGEGPANAALYQIFILFCIAGGVALGTIGVVLGCVRLVFDERGRLRSERIVPLEDR